MKEKIKNWLGIKNMSRFRLLKRRFKGGCDAVDLQSTFSRIYQENHWGGEDGTPCSGEGSSLDFIVTPYVHCIRALLEQMPEQDRLVVDLGCGDFQVGRRYADLCKSYTGVDIVPALVERNGNLYGTDRITFRHLDITADSLPGGRICLIRQVLQHLSNQQISAVLAKLIHYPVVVITEHYPRPENLLRKNIDKPAGAEVRALYGSGVYFDAKPFMMTDWNIETLLEVEGSSLGADVDPGVIITYVMRRSC